MPHLTSNITTLDKLLISLGYDEWKTITFSFILPAINTLGAIFCSLSAFTFFSGKFVDSIFYYYRLLCIVYIIYLIHNILLSLLLTPQYFPKMNTYLSSAYQIYYIVAASILFHFEDVLQMAILLTRMKLYSLFVEKYFTFSPRLVSLTLFLICFCINLPLSFGFKISSFGEYLDMAQQENIKFYFFDSSNFSFTLIGQILFGFTILFLNIILSVVIGVGLNVFSLIKYKSYVRKEMLEVCRLIQGSINKRLTTTL